MTTASVSGIDVKKLFTFFIVFIKKRVLTAFNFLERFYFLVAKFVYSTKPAKILLNLLNSCRKRFLSRPNVF